MLKAVFFDQTSTDGSFESQIINEAVPAPTTKVKFYIS